jgi:hypothetical protein
VTERVPAALLRSSGDHAGYPRDGTPEVGSARLVPRVADNLMLVAGEQPCQKNGVVVSDEGKGADNGSGGDREGERERTADEVPRPVKCHRNRGIPVAPGKSLADIRLLRGSRSVPREPEVRFPGRPD